ncbi:hypothetical protein IW261DRAFT_1420268 [Armillaria novae-zelandiae]|uniref:Uncharacterized protein n=1 Tax=Armillaria novae-zelandiae TaxID=153914 RepID=A0AA39P7V8_9AGAR|nr:hypothetical protein IW261DRAFT_1420268 [Armillaria novae-zelandiae]
MYHFGTWSDPGVAGDAFLFCQYNHFIDPLLLISHIKLQGMNITSSTIVEMGLCMKLLISEVKLQGIRTMSSTVVEIHAHRYKWNEVQYILMWVCDTMYGSILCYVLEAGSKLQVINMKPKAQTTGRLLADSVANDKRLQTGNNSGTSRIIIGCLLTFQYLDITVASVQEVTHEDMENTGKSQIYRQQCSTIQFKHMFLHANGSELGGDAGQEMWYDFQVRVAVMTITYIWNSNGCFTQLQDTKICVVAPA